MEAAVRAFAVEAVRLAGAAGLSPLYVLLLVGGFALALVGLHALEGAVVAGVFRPTGPQTPADENGPAPDPPSSPPVSMEGRETDGMG